MGVVVLVGCSCPRGCYSKGNREDAHKNNETNTNITDDFIHINLLKYISHTHDYKPVQFHKL